jgi:hypothetical protein
MTVKILNNSKIMFEHDNETYWAVIESGCCGLCRKHIFIHDKAKSMIGEFETIDIYPEVSAPTLSKNSDFVESLVDLATSIITGKAIGDALKARKEEKSVVNSG